MDYDKAEKRAHRMMAVIMLIALGICIIVFGRSKNDSEATPNVVSSGSAVTVEPTSWVK